MLKLASLATMIAAFRSWSIGVPPLPAATSASSDRGGSRYARRSRVGGASPATMTSFGSRGSGSPASTTCPRIPSTPGAAPARTAVPAPGGAITGAPMAAPPPPPSPIAGANVAETGAELGIAVGMPGRSSVPWPRREPPAGMSHSPGSAEPRPLVTDRPFGSPTPVGAAESAPPTARAAAPAGRTRLPSV